MEQYIVSVAGSLALADTIIVYCSAPLSSRSVLQLEQLMMLFDQ
jgi:hypothetical protein